MRYSSQRSREVTCGFLCSFSMYGSSSFRTSILESQYDGLPPLKRWLSTVSSNEMSSRTDSGSDSARALWRLTVFLLICRAAAMDLIDSF